MLFLIAVLRPSVHDRAALIEGIIDLGDHTHLAGGSVHAVLLATVRGGKQKNRSGEVVPPLKSGAFQTIDVQILDREFSRSSFAILRPHGHDFSALLKSIETSIGSFNSIPDQVRQTFFDYLTRK
jgi:hypothetical protein